MPTSRRSVVVGLATGLLVAAGVGVALAQPAADGYPVVAQHGGTAPIRCYLAATEETGMSDTQARLLCVGALSDAPARCAALADDESGLSEPQAVQLCLRAESTEPVRCYERLQDETFVSDAQLVGYCAGTRWPLVVPPDGGSPACLAAAFEETNLSDSMALDLCRGAAGPDPVACFLLGEDATTLSDDALLALCATVVEAYPVYPPGLP